LNDAWREASRGEPGDRLTATLFALPLVLVAAGKDVDAEIAGVLRDSAGVATVLREHRALGGNQTFALAAPLVASDAFDLTRLPQLLAWQRQAAGGGVDRLDWHPTPIATKAGQEGVHLRFLVGVALTAPGADVLKETDNGPWAMALAQELARQLAGPGYSVLALPRGAQSPLAARQRGRAAQRDILASLGVPRDVIRVLPNGVDVDKYAPGPSDQRARFDAARLFSYVGRLDPEKNVAELLEAFLAADPPTGRSGRRARVAPSISSQARVSISSVSDSMK